MATYAIGDVQGCYQDLLALTAKINFDPTKDRLWFTGDLVNRGPQSLQVLRFVVQLGDRAVTVLGNHDLHLLALRFGDGIKARARDTLDEVLAADDCDNLLDWLRHRPLLHHDRPLGYALVHAGLCPQWTLGEATVYAHEVEDFLQSNQFPQFLTRMYGNQPNRWSAELGGFARLRVITNYLTRMRFCTDDGRLALDAKGDIGSQGPGLLPWFMVPTRKSKDTQIIFGHWSTLRLAAADRLRHKAYPVDTGAVWGGQLTAMRLEDQACFSVQGSSGIEIPAD